MKRLITLLLAVALSLALVGCGGKGDASVSDKDDVQEQLDEMQKQIDLLKNENDELKNSDEKEEENAESFSKMGADEQLIFEKLIIGTSYFHNPSSVRVMGISKINEISPDGNYPTGRKYVYIKIQATNKLGGTISDYYTLDLKAYSFKSSNGVSLYHNEGEVTESSSSLSSLLSETNYNIVDINNALRDHFVAMGLN